MAVDPNPFECALLPIAIDPGWLVDTPPPPIAMANKAEAVAASPMAID
jgi:hypothetical protein